MFRFFRFIVCWYHSWARWWDSINVNIVSITNIKIRIHFQASWFLHVEINFACIVDDWQLLLCVQTVWRCIYPTRGNQITGSCQSWRYIWNLFHKKNRLKKCDWIVIVCVIFWDNKHIKIYCIFSFFFAFSGFFQG